MHKPATTSTTTENTPGGKSKVVVLIIKEQQLEALKEDLKLLLTQSILDYYAAGRSKVATKIATEKQFTIAPTQYDCDPSNYVTFKEQGIFVAYESPEAANGRDLVPKDPEHLAQALRLVRYGLTTNTKHSSRK